MSPYLDRPRRSLLNVALDPRVSVETRYAAAVELRARDTSAWDVRRLGRDATSPLAPGESNGVRQRSERAPRGRLGPDPACRRDASLSPGDASRESPAIPCAGDSTLFKQPWWMAH